MGEKVEKQEQNKDGKKGLSKEYTFVVSDESIVNSYGFRVMTSGIDISHYKKNPIVLFFHKRPYKWDGKVDKNTTPLPIGKSVKVWKEDGKLMATLVFDLDDEFAEKVADKIEKDIIRMCSPGLDPITVSEDEKYHLKGQTRHTLVKSRLEEISIVDRGANDNALRLYDGGQMIELSADGENDIIPKINQNQNSMDTLKSKLAEKLELNAEASDDAFVQAVDGLLATKTEFVALSAQVKEGAEARIKSLVELNCDTKFTADKKEHFLQLGASIGETELAKLFEVMPGIAKKPTEELNNGGSGGSDNPTPTPEGEFKNFVELSAKGTDFIASYKEKEPEKYQKLYDDHFKSED